MDIAAVYDGVEAKWMGVANGDPLDVRTSVKQVYIGGVAIPMGTRQTRLRDEYTPKK